MANTIEDLIERVQDYDPYTDVSKIIKAFEFANQMHLGQYRESGESYIAHPLETAYILADLEQTVDVIVAGLLHDIIEDTDANYAELEQQFGETVAFLVQGVTKLDKLQFVTGEEHQVETVRKMVIAMASDIRVIIIKFADRLHNMRTLKSLKAEKQRRKAKETLDVYAPIADRMGIYKIKWELEDLSLRYIDTVAYKEISDLVSIKKEERNKQVERIKETLKKKLETQGIHAIIEGRAKHFYSIWKKMFVQGKSFEEIHDLIAVRVIVDTVSDCYSVLGMVHQLYKPIMGRFKDYISMPKPNKYQSLHTTVMGVEGTTFEVQIRTFEMHRVAEIGIAAHWKYKEGRANSKNDSDIKWVIDLLEAQKNANNTEDFMRTIKVDLFVGEVFVFTPKGDVINLPQGSTPIDFAFAIHSNVGLRMIGAKVNSKIMPLNYVLCNGDIVEISTSTAVHGPSPDWLRIVKTARARNKINQWFKKEYREENIARGKEMMQRELKKLNLSEEAVFANANVEIICKRYGLANLEDIYAALGYGTLTTGKIITRVREKEEKKPEQQQPNRPAGLAGVIVEGIDGCLVRIARCCAPLPGDEIVGFVTRGRGISVHRKTCTNALSLSKSQRLIECKWGDNEKSRYRADIRLEGAERKGLLADVTNAITEMKINVSACHAVMSKDKIATICATVEIRNVEQVAMLIKKLHQVPGVFEAMRV